ncbi:hypothetical protein K440DRAFT_661579 [Wilcoxina mikolae CBS 423.85]|nr:hypothetical protein K440DRAFT_661579 [Wilcoxina mikolae CBS 423.85]
MRLFSTLASSLVLLATLSACNAQLLAPLLNMQQQTATGNAKSAASKSLSALDKKLETAYTTASGWSKFSKGQETALAKLVLTQTKDPQVSSLLYNYATNSASNADESFSSVLNTISISSDLVAELYTTLISYVSTQTYLPSDVRQSYLSDIVLATKLEVDATASTSAAKPATTSKNGSVGIGEGRLLCIVGGFVAGVVALVVAL